MLCPNVFNCLASGHMMGLDFLALLWLGGAIWVVLPIELWMEVTCHPDVSINFLGQDPFPFSMASHSGPSIILNLWRIMTWPRGVVSLGVLRINPHCPRPLHATAPRPICFLQTGRAPRRETSGSPWEEHSGLLGVPVRPHTASSAAGASCHRAHHGAVTASTSRPAWFHLFQRKKKKHLSCILNSAWWVTVK